MKIMMEGRVLGRWNLSVAIGFIITAIGLCTGLLLIYQILPVLLHGVALTINTSTLLIEALTSMLMTLLGFGLMVLGSDPFEDASGDFQSPVENENSDSHERTTT